MKNPFKAMHKYVTENGNGLEEVCMPLVYVSKVFLVATAPVVGVTALFQKEEKR